MVLKWHDPSRIKPKKSKPAKPAKPATAEVILYKTPKEAMEELSRRIQVLGQVTYLYEELAIREATKEALDLSDTALTDPRYKSHSSYGKTIDVYETPEGLLIGVPEDREKAALSADIGTKTIHPQPLWDRTQRAAELKVEKDGKELAEAIAEAAEQGEPLTLELVDNIQEKQELTDDDGFDQLREILKKRKALINKEKVP